MVFGLSNTGPRVRMVATGTLTTIGIMAMWTWIFGTFVPTNLGLQIALGVGLLLGCALSMSAPGDARFDPKSAKYDPSLESSWAKNPYARTMGMGVITTVMGFYAAFAAFSFWNYVVGKPGEIEFHIGEYRSGGRRTCSGFYLYEVPFFVSRICASYRSEDLPPEGRPIRIAGMVSPLGVNRETFEIVQPPLPPLSEEYRREFVDPPAEPAERSPQEAAAVAKACPPMQALWPDWRVDCDNLIARRVNSEWIVHLGRQKIADHVGPTAKLSDDLELTELYLAH